MRYGRVRFYVDENVESYLIEHIRHQGFRVISALELGLFPRDDKFHLQEARRRGCILLTRDTDFLNDTTFPFHYLKKAGIVVLRTDNTSGDGMNFGYALVCLLEEIGASGNQNLHGLKIEIKGPKMIVRAQTRGQVREDVVDISGPLNDRELFQR